MYVRNRNQFFIEILYLILEYLVFHNNILYAIISLLIIWYSFYDTK